MYNGSTYEDLLRAEVYDRASGNRLTRSDVTYLITEHGLTYNEVFNDIGDSINQPTVILTYLGY